MKYQEGMHVFSFEDGTQFIAARSEQEAQEEFKALFSLGTTDEDPPPCHQLTEEELDTLKVVVLNEDEEDTGERQSMRQQLADAMSAHVEDEDAFFLCGED